MWDGCIRKTRPEDDLELSQIRLSSYIRAGKSDSINHLIKMKGSQLLQTVYSFQVHFKRKKHLHIEIGNENRRNSPCIEDDSYNQVTLEVSPLHLAIISKQESSLDAILELSTTQDMCSLGVENEKVNELISTRVKVNFRSDDKKSYENSDLMLDGMNILHLAAKYYANGLEKIIQLSQTHKGLCDQINKMLLETDSQIKNTPLHVAAHSSSIVALR